MRTAECECGWSTTFECDCGCEATVISLAFNQHQSAHRLRYLEKLIDTRATPWWKRLLFRIDGFGPWYQLTPVPKKRPWRKWWTS